MSLYPKSPERVAAPQAMDADLVAARILEGMETGKITYSFTTATYGATYTLPGLSRADFLGPCLLLPDDPDDSENPGRGSDDVATFNRIWDEIHREKLELGKVNAIEHSTESEYVAALQDRAKHLDPQKWADGTIAAAEVTGFSELKAKLAEGLGGL